MPPQSINDDQVSGRKRKHEPSQRLKDYLVFNLEDVNQLSDDPRNYSEAMKQIDSKKWEIAMKQELESIEKKKVWKWVDLLDKRKSIGCKWVLKKKLKTDGSLDRYKARLVVKGYT